MGRTKVIGATVLVLGAILCAGVPRAEAIVTPLTNFNTTVDVLNAGGGPGHDITGWSVDGIHEYNSAAAGSSWTYRVNGGALMSLDSLAFVSSTATTPTGDPFDFSPTTLTTVYQDVANGLQFTTRYQIAGGTVGSGTSTIQTQMTVNLLGGAGTTAVDIFELNNLDLTGTAGNDVVRTRPTDAGRTVIQSDLSTTFGESSTFQILTGGNLVISDPSARQADVATTVAAAAAAGVLTNTPAPGASVGPSDVAYAYEYSFSLAPGTPAQSFEVDVNRSVNVAKTWTAGPQGTGTDFTTPSNWSGGVLPVNDIFTDVAVFPIKGSLANPNLAGPYSLYGIYFADAGWNLNGTGTLTLGASGILSTGSGTNTISLANMVLGASMPLDVVSGNTLVISSHVNLNGFTLRKLNPGTALLSGPVTGAGDIVIDGGTMTLNGNNTFTGGVTLNPSGTLNLGSATALGTGTFTLNGGTFDNTSGAALTLTSNNAQQWNGNFTFTGTNSLDMGTGAVALGNNVTATINAATLTVGGNVSGGFGLTKAGAGVLTLSGTNTFTGGTTLNAGTLNINSATALGTGLLTINGGTIDNTSGAPLTLTSNNAQQWNGAFTFKGSNALNLGAGAVTLGSDVTVTTVASNLTVGGNISGGFTLTKAGAGALTLSGDNAFTGGTTLAAGTLNINSATALGSGTFTLNGGTIDNTSGAAVTLTTNNPLLVAGDFTFAGSNALNLGTGLVTLQGNRTITVTASTLTIGGSIGETSSSALAVNGAGQLILTGASTFTGATTIGAGATLQLGSGAAAGSISTTSTVTDNGTLVFNHSDNVVFAPAIAGTGAVVQTGPGALTLSGANSFSGGVVLNSGTLNLSSATSIGTGTLTINGGAIDNTSGGPLTLTNNNPEIWNGSFTFVGSNPLDLGTGAVTLGHDVTITVAASSLTVDGNISGAFGLTKTGGVAGALTLAGDNTFTGGVTLNSGGLNLQSATALGTGTFTINGGNIDNTSGAPLTLTTNNAQAWNADFVFAGSNALDLGTGPVTLSGNRTVTVNSSTLTVGGPISGAGAGLTVGGGGTLVLTGANTYTGATAIAVGSTLQIGNGGTTGSIDSSSGITDNGALIFDRSNTVAFGNVISGTGSLTQTGTGTLILTGADTYSGTTTIAAGATLQLGNGGTTGTINNSNSVLDNGTLVFNHSDDVILSKIIAGTGGLTQAGPGSLTINAVNSYTGPTAVNGGTLAIPNLMVLFSNTTVGNAGTLNLTGGIVGTLTSSGTVVGTGQITGNTHITGGSISPAGTGIGTLSTGAFTLDAPGTYKVDFDFGGGTSDQIVVTGTATLGSGSTIEMHQVDSTFITTNKNFTVFTASGGVTDAGVVLASAASQFFHLTGQVVANDNFVVTVNRVNFVTVANVGNNHAIAGALDKITAQGSANADVEALLNGLEGLITPESFNAALAGLSPEFFGAPTEVTEQGIHRYHQSLADFLSERRSDEPVTMTESSAASSIPFNTNGLANAMAAPLPVAMATDVGYMGDSTAIGADEGIGRNNDFDLFLRPFGLFGNRTGTMDRLGYHYNAEGFMAGVDHKLAAPWIVVGVAGGYNHSNLTYANRRGTTDGDSLRAGPYISFVFHPGPIEQWFVDASVTGGYHWVDSDRVVAGPSIVTGTASSSYEAYDIAAYLATGFKVPGTGKFNVLPTASIDYDFYHHGGFTEHGGPTGTDLSIQSDGIGSLQSAVGVRVQYRAVAGSVVLVPEISVAWIHDFLHQNDVTANFANTNAPFTVSSGLTAQDGARFGAALNAIVTRRLSAFLRYDGEVQSHHNNHMVSAGVDIGF